jgi:hypothetical protein
LRFEIPQLTADSSVTSINLSIPSAPVPVYVESKDQKVGKVAPDTTRTFKVRAGLTRKAKRGKRTVIRFRTNAKGVNVKIDNQRIKVE